MEEPAISLRQPRKVTLVASIVEQLVENIQSGTLKPGDKLPSERQLIQMLGVGRSSVREALQGLVMMGLVEVRPGHGSYVNDNLHTVIPDLSKPDLSDKLQREMRLHLIETRRMIEVEIAGQAAIKAKADQVDRWRVTFRDYARYIDDFGDPLYMSAHNDFHLTMADMTQNPFNVMVVKAALQAIPQTLREREFMFPKAVDLPLLRESQVKIHQDIFDAVVSRDPDAAKHSVHAHMDSERDLVRLVYPATGDGH